MYLMPAARQPGHLAADPRFPRLSVLGWQEATVRCSGGRHADQSLDRAVSPRPSPVNPR